MTPALVPLAGVLLEGARDVLDRVLPDPKERAAAELELRKLEAAGTFTDRAGLAIALAQAETNKAEASGQSSMQRLWRPLMGWACALSLAYCWIVHPLLVWLATVQGWPVPPAIDTEQQRWIVMQMLGLAAARTVEKIKGVA